MTYPEMNAKIVGILRISDSPDVLYAADRIEELERRVAELESWGRQGDAALALVRTFKAYVRELKNSVQAFLMHVDWKIMPTPEAKEKLEELRRVLEKPAEVLEVKQDD